MLSPSVQERHMRHVQIFVLIVTVACLVAFVIAT